MVVSVIVNKEIIIIISLPGRGSSLFQSKSSSTATRTVPWTVPTSHSVEEEEEHEFTVPKEIIVNHHHQPKKPHNNAAFAHTVANGTIFEEATTKRNATVLLDEAPKTNHQGTTNTNMAFHTFTY